MYLEEFNSDDGNVYPDTTKPGPNSTYAIVPATTPASQAGGNWVLIQESKTMNLHSTGYRSYWPAVDTPTGTRMFNDLKVTTKTDVPVDVRFTTEMQALDYQAGWQKWNNHETASFDPATVGYVALYEGVNNTSVEEHAGEGLVVFIEPHGGVPVKGQIQVYYQS
ncbi:MAG: hypothetical protein M0Q92_05150 [Methanoregula sp.]|nr:hypothetical protein [Methanoregula sp.]